MYITLEEWIENQTKANKQTKITKKEINKDNIKKLDNKITWKKNKTKQKQKKRKQKKPMFTHFNNHVSGCCLFSLFTWFGNHDTSRLGV